MLFRSLPPALLTNAFANPLKVCAAGVIIMTPIRPLLQRTSLCCAKMRMSVLDDGGEVMAIAIGVYRVSPPLIRSQPRAGQRPLSAVRSIEVATRLLAVLGASHLHIFGISFILQTLLSTVG